MSAADDYARGAALADRPRGERARDTLDASLRAAGIDGFSSGYDWEARRVVIRFDSPTDAYLAATRLAFLRTGPHPDTPGEGEPAHYEVIDGPVRGSDWANRRPPWPPEAERRLPEETGRRFGW